LSDSAYEALVKRTVSDIEANAGRGTPVFRGQVLDLAFLLERIREITLDPQVQEYSGTLFDYLHRFEAMTGTPCRHLFDDEDNALPLSIQAALEMFIKLGGLSRFRRGQRYFFGHPIG
jgi:hypothetical protein